MANDKPSRGPKEAEPHYVDANGRRQDRALWDDILGDDRRPWDITAADLIKRRPLTPGDDKRRT